MSDSEFFGGFDQRLIDQILTKGHGWGLPEPTPPDQIPAALGGTRPAGEWAQNTSEPVRILKAATIIQVPDELLMDAGVIPDTRPPRPPLPWRTRLRYRIGDWRESLARRAYRIIAGYEVPDYDE